MTPPSLRKMLRSLRRCKGRLFSNVLPSHQSRLFLSLAMKQASAAEAWEYRKSIWNKASNDFISSKKSQHELRISVKGYDDITTTYGSITPLMIIKRLNLQGDFLVASINGNVRAAYEHLMSEFYNKLI